MKIGVVSDTHYDVLEGNIKKFFENLSNEVDFLIHAGDIDKLDFLIDLKMMFENRFVAVSGNMDSGKILEHLNDIETITIEKLRISVTHTGGHPSETVEKAIETFKKTPSDIIIFGHSHHPYNQYHGKTLLFNPGSLMDKRYAPYTSYGILEINNGKIISSNIIPVTV
ncbi:MAG: metallophosphoesterase [Candidatus Muirbacterium halophilum]|nr:metallophosphoesterase [Candidatus Muirbacterium halophilum]MCK9476697.1 metallophosphoesterase [Candidatus Muirbacterium halophilum]